MADVASGAGIKQARCELQQYLCDQLAPLMALDAVDALLDRPPEVTAAAIQEWLESQFQLRGASALVSDYLFHAIKKIWMMAEFKLVPSERLAPFLNGLAGALLQICPADERAELSDRIKRLGRSDSLLTSTSPSVEVPHRARPDDGGSSSPARLAGGAFPPSAKETISESVAHSLRRFSLLLDRLERSPASAPGPGAASPSSDVVPQLLATAALGARGGSEFEQHLRRLAGLGVGATPEDLFRALGRSLPGWVVPVAGGADAGIEALVSGRSAEAMRRIVSMADDPEESAQRFAALVHAAIEQFNAGALPQAVTMFELAAGLIAERRLDPATIMSLQSRAHENLSVDRLRALAEDPQKHALLRKALNFFPALAPKRLLEDLMREERRDRRKLALTLLEIHGPASRAEAMALLESCVAGALPDPEGAFRRDLVFLLRRIPRPADAPLDDELTLLVSGIQPDQPPLVAKEAIGALGQIKDKRAAQALAARLHDLEQDLLSRREVDESAAESFALLDRVAAALARVGTPDALRTVVNHAFSRQARFGSAVARLDGLASHDLSADGGLVARLVDMLREALPKKVLGLFPRRKSDEALRIVQALSGTPAAAVKRVFAEITERFPDQEFADAARRALAAFGAPPRPAEAPAKLLSGDLELFGLPSLLQNLAESQVTGELTLADGEGATVGTLILESGKLRTCQAGPLSGETAVHALFEKPFPGTFTFASRRAGGDKEQPSAAPPLEVLPIILEGVRRHDEYQQARAVVGDDVTLKAAGKPTHPEGEADAAFLRAVWTRVLAGATPAVCESALPVDPFRVRRLLAHWIEEGALQPA